MERRDREPQTSHLGGQSVWGVRVGDTNTNCDCFEWIQWNERDFSESTKVAVATADRFFLQRKI